MWYATTSLLPVGVLVGVAVLARHADRGVRARRTPVFLLLALDGVRRPRAVPVRRTRLLLLRRAARQCSPGSRCSGTRPCTRRRTASSRRCCSRRSSPSDSWSTTACSTGTGLRPNGNPQTVDPRPRSSLDTSQPDGTSRLPRDVGAAPCARARRLRLRRPGHARDLRAHGTPQPDEVAVRLPRPVELRAGTRTSCARSGATA